MLLPTRAGTPPMRHLPLWLSLQHTICVCLQLIKKSKKIWYYNQLMRVGKRVVAGSAMCPNTLRGNNNWGRESYNCNSWQCSITRLKQCMSQNETMHKLGSKITCKCQFKQNNIMQHYKVCRSKQFPTLFSLPQACPCCMLCTICVKNAARDELLFFYIAFYARYCIYFVPCQPN